MTLPPEPNIWDFLEPMGIDETHASVQKRLLRKLRIQHRLNERKQAKPPVEPDPDPWTKEDSRQFQQACEYLECQRRLPPEMRDKVPKYSI